MLGSGDRDIIKRAMALQRDISKEDLPTHGTVEPQNVSLLNKWIYTCVENKVFLSRSAIYDVGRLKIFMKNQLPAFELLRHFIGG